jgi:hypothetical protein
VVQFFPEALVSVSFLIDSLIEVMKVITKLGLGSIDEMVEFVEQIV